VRQKTVVVPVVDHLNENGLGNPVAFHQAQQRFRRGVALGDILAGCERKFGIVFPHVNVGIKDAIVGGCECGGSERCSHGCSDGCSDEGST